METCDLSIIGGGTSGLYAALCAAQYKLSVRIIEPSSQLGGQPKWLYPDKDITNIPGHVRIKGAQLADNLIAQAMTANPLVCLSEEVSGLSVLDGDGYIRVETNAGVHLTRAVIISTRSRTKQRRLKFAYDSGLDGSLVFYGAPDRARFLNKRVLVVGGGSSAAEWAAELKGGSASLLLINRGDRLESQPALVQRLIDRAVEVKCCCELTSIETFGESLRCRMLQQGVPVEAEFDVILACLGSDPDHAYAERLGLQTSDRGIAVGGAMQTNLSRVYAIGDAADYPFKQRLIVAGFGEAAIAVGHIAQQLSK